MAEKIVEIAGDALALRDLREMLDLLACDAQPCVRAADLAVMNVDPADDQYEHRRPRGVEEIALQKQRFDRGDERNGDHAAHRGAR